MIIFAGLFDLSMDTVHVSIVSISKGLRTSTECTLTINTITIAQWATAEGTHNDQLADPFQPAKSLVPDLDCVSDPFSLRSVWLWEAQRLWEPDGPGKRHGASHWPPWEGGPLRWIYWWSSRFCFMASAECDQPSAGVGHVVPQRLMQDPLPFVFTSSSWMYVRSNTDN